MSKNGFSLLEMMMGLAIGGIAMSAIIGALSFTMKQRRMANQPVESSLLFDRVNQIIVRDNQCKSALTSVANHVNTSAPTPLVVASDLHRGVNLGHGVSIASLNLKINSAAGVSITTPTGAQTRYPAWIEMQTSQTVQAQTVLSNVRTIPLHVIVDSTNKIVDCNADVSDQVTCTDMGGTWNPTPPPGFQQCTPKSYCVYGGSFSAHDATFAGFTNIMDGNHYGCPSGYNPQKGGVLDIAVKSGKYGVTNAIYPIYNCVQCGSDLAQVADTVSAPTTGSLGTTPICNPDGTGCTTMNQDAIDACNSEYTVSSTLSTLGSFFGRRFSPAGPNDCP